MSRPQKKYIIEIRCRDGPCGCPEDEVLIIRKRLGEAYMEFVMEYIDSLELCQEEKDYIYAKVLQKLKSP